MKIEILMPAMSPSMNEGDLTKWFIKVGDYLRVGDPIAEIQTDKAAMDIESDSEGTVIELLVQEGQEKIAVKTPIAFLDNNTEKLRGKLFTNTIDENLSFQRKFNRFYDLPSSSDIHSNTDLVVEEIASLLSQDIFNASLGNW